MEPAETKVKAAIILREILSVQLGNGQWETVIHLGGPTTIITENKPVWKIGDLVSITIEKAKP